jgi:hypothetical protein
VVWIAAYRIGSGGKGIGRLRTICNRVSSVSRPCNRSSATRAPKRLATTPSPVYPTAYATRPPMARPKVTQKRLQVSMAPAHRWVNRIPSSCGKVAARLLASSSKVGAWSSSSGRMPFRKW